MLPALLMIAALADWTPVRWFASDAASLDLLAGTAFNSVLVEPEQWNGGFVSAAHQRGIAVAGLIRESPGAAEEAGSWQGVWPGLNAQEEDGGVLAGPTAAPWLDTNSGFLRYVRSRVRARLWMANRPPEGRIYPVRRYLEAMADAALAGAWWVVALDRDFGARLAHRQARALDNWKQICSFAAFLQKHGAWRDWATFSRLGLAEEPAQGALVSGSVLDMIAVQHIPVKLLTGNLDPGMRVVVNLTGKPMAAPVVVAPEPGWRFPVPPPEEYAIRKADLPKLEELWKQVSKVTARQNFGMRLFNGSGMLSRPLISLGGKRLAVPVVNYTGYPVEGVTVHLAGQWNKARLLAPGRDPRELVLYDINGGKGIEIAGIDLMAILEVE